MITVSTGQRWKYVWNDGTSIVIEVLYPDTSWGDKGFKCKVVEIISGTRYKIGDVTGWNFSTCDDSNHWTYFVGQDAPAEGA